MPRAAARTCVLSSLVFLAAAVSAQAAIARVFVSVNGNDTKESRRGGGQMRHRHMRIVDVDDKHLYELRSTCFPPWRR